MLPSLSEVGELDLAGALVEAWCRAKDVLKKCVAERPGSREFCLALLKVAYELELRRGVAAVRGVLVSDDDLVDGVYVEGKGLLVLSAHVLQAPPVAAATVIWELSNAAGLCGEELRELLLEAVGELAGREVEVDLEGLPEVPLEKLIRGEAELVYMPAPGC